MLHLGLPPILEKILCTFLDNRTAKISIGTEHSNDINLQSGVPQGSVLSPTLYTLYTNDLPIAGPGCIDTMYADDVTQVITTPSKSKNMMKLKVEREIERINKYERKWKIQTSEEKFKIVPLAQYKTKQITINDKNYNTSKDGKFLGLKLSVTGLSRHVTEKIKKGNGILGRLKRFRNLTPKIKTTLIKTLLIPVIEYPPIPLCSVAKTNKINMQKLINKGIRFINSNDRERDIMENLHLKYNITPYNISIHKKACKIWQAVRLTDEENFNTLVTHQDRIHHWFPKTSNVIQAPLPEPVYTS